MKNINILKRTKLLASLAALVVLSVSYQNCSELQSIQSGQNTVQQTEEVSFPVGDEKSSWNSPITGSEVKLGYPDFGLEGLRISSSTYENAESNKMDNGVGIGFVHGITNKRLFVKIRNAKDCKIEFYGNGPIDYLYSRGIACDGSSGVKMTDLYIPNYASMNFTITGKSLDEKYQVNEAINVACPDKPSSMSNWVCGVYPQHAKLFGMRMSDTSVNSYEAAADFGYYGKGNVEANTVAGVLRFHFKALARRCYYIPLAINGEPIQNTNEYLKPENEVPCIGYKDIELDALGNAFDVGDNWVSQVGFVAATGFAGTLQGIPPLRTTHLLSGDCSKSSAEVRCRLKNGDKPEILGLRLAKSPIDVDWFAASSLPNYDSRRLLRVVFAARAEKCWYGPADQGTSGNYLIENNSLYEVPCSGGMNYNVHRLNGLPASGYAVFLARVGGQLQSKLFSSNCKQESVDGKAYRACSFCEVDSTSGTCPYTWSPENSANYFDY